MAVTDLTSEEQLVEDRCTQLLAEHDPSSTPAREFLGHQFDLGLAWAHFPEGCGGLGLGPRLQRTINDRLSAAGAPNPVMRNPIGHGMGAPTIVAHGSTEQQQRYLRPLFTGEEVWCQLFSEPGAGSDVASLSTRATQDGDEWVVDGQKVWTTLAHISRWGMLLARTDPTQPKHKGMTYFVVDMHAPGVEVRPLRQMTGEAEFNEVYFTGARVPDVERLGDVGDGWRVAITTLMNERVSIGGTIPPRGSGPIASAVRAHQESGHASPAARDELMRLWIEAEVARLTNIRAAQNRRQGTPGPEGSIGKLVYAELNKRIHDFVVDAMGANGMLYGSYEMARPEIAMGSDSPQKSFLRAQANSIEGGTSDIMRNILGERTLGLPGDVRVDKGLPWSEVPRS
ncbi:MAG: acyl-CoA dehydrogenase family protein [Actinomycetota bacterium]|nr:acyl-CoA dehydrogenase family protein [Actinomycetota bacterium]